MLFATVIFLAALALIASERVRAGIPVTVVSVVLCGAYVMLRYA